MTAADVPQAPEAEAAICSVLLEPSVSDTLLPIVRELLPTAIAFQNPANAEIYQSILDVADRGLKPNKVDVVYDLRSRGVLEKVGGPSFVRIDPQLSSDPVTVRSHAEAIVEARKKRELQRIFVDGHRGAANGRSSCEILERVRAAIDKIDAAVADDRLVWTEHTVLFEMGAPPMVWDIEGLLARDDGPVLQYGDPESGKSAIALHVSKCMATGEKVFGEFAASQRPRALYLNLDAGAKGFARRALMLGRPIPGLGIASPQEFTLERFREAVAANPGAFISVDCFAEIFNPDPAAEQGAEMRSFVRAARALYELHGCNGIWIDHANRSNLATSERYYGSVQKRASFRQMWATDRVRTRDEREGRIRVKLTCVKQSEAEKFASIYLDLEWVDGECRVHYAGKADEAADRASQGGKDAEVVLAVLTKAAAPLRRTQIESETGLPRDRVRAALNDDRIDSIGPERSPKRAYFVRDMVANLGIGDDL